MSTSRTTPVALGIYKKSQIKFFNRIKKINNFFTGSGYHLAGGVYDKTSLSVFEFSSIKG
jgi:hypothetical protein